VFVDNKVLITGGSTGIGKQLATDFLRLGSHVAIASNDTVKLESARAELSTISPHISALACDVGEPHQVKNMAQSYLRQFGAPDIVVNNAGYALYRTFEEMSSDEIWRLLVVNFGGACLVTREFLPAMIQRGRGNIVCMASIAGRIPMTPCGVYSAAKHGMVAWATTLKAELKRFRIHVHVICPGRVETDFFQHRSFVERQPRPEARWTVTVEQVSQATISAVRGNRFMTYIPRSQGLMVWLANSFSLVARPALNRVMGARVDEIYRNRNRSLT
jgi:short-subunit dehydrogenase